MDVARIERGEAKLQRRHRHVGDQLGRPAALAVDHSDRPHMAVKRQFGGTLMKDLAVDVARLLRRQEDAKRCGPKIGILKIAEDRYWGLRWR